MSNTLHQDTVLDTVLPSYLARCRVGSLIALTIRFEFNPFGKMAAKQNAAMIADMGYQTHLLLDPSIDENGRRFCQLDVRAIPPLLAEDLLNVLATPPLNGRHNPFMNHSTSAVESAIAVQLKRALRLP